MRCSVNLILFAFQFWAVVIPNSAPHVRGGKIFKQEIITLQLTFNPGLTLTDFWTTQPCSVTNHSDMLKYGKNNNVAHKPGKCRQLYHWCSHRILTSSVIYHWTDRKQRGIYLPWLFVKKRKENSLWHHLCVCPPIHHKYETVIMQSNFCQLKYKKNCLSVVNQVVLYIGLIRELKQWRLQRQGQCLESKWN